MSKLSDPNRQSPVRKELRRYATRLLPLRQLSIIPAQTVCAIHIAFLTPCLGLLILSCHSPSSTPPPSFSSPILCCRHLQVGCRDSGATFRRHMATAFVCAARRAFCHFRELSPAHQHVKRVTAPHTGHAQACRHQAMQFYAAFVHFEDTRVGFTESLPRQKQLLN